MENLNRAATVNCVVCGVKPGVIFGGHVHKDKEDVIACVCKDCDKNEHQVMNDCKGCYGQWIPIYDYQANYFQFGYIEA